MSSGTRSWILRFRAFRILSQKSFISMLAKVRVILLRGSRTPCQQPYLPNAHISSLGQDKWVLGQDPESYDSGRSVLYPGSHLFQSARGKHNSPPPKIRGLLCCQGGCCASIPQTEISDWFQGMGWYRGRKSWKIEMNLRFEVIKWNNFFGSLRRDNIKSMTVLSFPGAGLTRALV